MENNKTLKVRCLYYSYSNLKGDISHTEVVPVCWIEKEYGSVEAFLNSKTEYYGNRMGEHITKKSNEYDKSYLPDILETKTTIDKITNYIEAINGEVNKKQILIFIESL